MYSTCFSVGDRSSAQQVPVCEGAGPNRHGDTTGPAACCAEGGGAAARCSLSAHCAGGTQQYGTDYIGDMWWMTCMCTLSPDGPACRRRMQCLSPACAFQMSDRNLRRALLTLETCRVTQYPFTDAQPVQLPDWEMYIQVCITDLPSHEALVRCWTAIQGPVGGHVF